MAGGGGDRGGEGRDDKMGSLGFVDGVSCMLLLEHGSGSSGYGSSNIVPLPQLMPRMLDPLISTHLGAVAAHLKNNPHGPPRRRVFPLTPTSLVLIVVWHPCLLFYFLINYRHTIHQRRLPGEEYSLLLQLL